MLTDTQIINSFRKSPIEFIRIMWHLTPQPLKEQYKDLAKQVSLKEFKAEWFEPFIRGKHITWQQWVILLAVEKAIKFAAPKRISVRSGHGIGKDACLSWLILWYLFCFKDAQVPCTAPTSEQIHDILWKEISVWLYKMPPEIKSLYDWTTGYVRIKERPETWFARARTARKENPEALAGVHGDFVFLIGDEASGIPDEVFKPAEGALTNENVLSMFVSNPTRLIGYFYDTHNSDKQYWQCFNFNSEDSPIVESDYCERIATKFGRESDEYNYMVLGEFPKAEMIDEKGYVALLVESDLKKAKEDIFVGKIRLGIDPAGGGKNETTWVARDNFKMKVMAKEKISTGKSIAQKTITLCDLLKITKKQAKKDVIIDGFGVGMDAVKELALAGWDVNAVNVGEKPRDETPEEKEDEKIYLNKRAMVYDRLKKWLRGGGELVDHPDWKQLLQIKYRRELLGKMRIMSKEDMRKLGIDSPDVADGSSLTFIEREETPQPKPYKQKEYESPWEIQGK